MPSSNCPDTCAFPDKGKHGCAFVKGMTGCVCDSNKVMLLIACGSHRRSMHCITLASQDQGGAATGPAHQIHSRQAMELRREAKTEGSNSHSVPPSLALPVLPVIFGWGPYCCLLPCCQFCIALFSRHANGFSQPPETNSNIDTVSCFNIILGPCGNFALISFLDLAETLNCLSAACVSQQTADRQFKVSARSKNDVKAHVLYQQCMVPLIAELLAATTVLLHLASEFLSSTCLLQLEQDCMESFGGCFQACSCLNAFSQTFQPPAVASKPVLNTVLRNISGTNMPESIVKKLPCRLAQAVATRLSINAQTPTGVAPPAYNSQSRKGNNPWIPSALTAEQQAKRRQSQR